MDAQETRIFTAVLITAVVFGGIVLFFIISVIRQQRRNLDLHKQNILAEITATERDRARIARDLHDELGPILSSVKLRINIFEFTDADDKVQIEKINDGIDTAVTRIREISHDLMPLDLLRTGLVGAIKEYVNGISNDILNITFRCSGDIELSEQASVNIYRIIQEIIHNTIKHAQATHLSIAFIKEKGRLIITVKDNGIGFEQKEIQGGLGLKSLHSRAKLLNGKIFLESKKGTGTEFIFEIPC